MIKCNLFSKARRVLLRGAGLALLPAFGIALSGPAPAFAQDRYAAPAEAYRKGDYGTAFKLWLRLAEEGNRGAYYNLGNLYLHGRGVSLDLIEAYKWFLMADRAKLTQAKRALERMDGLMAKPDKQEAIRRMERWHNLYPRSRR